ncbi:MAG TPA: winged helix-turn-helix domain-containing protein [Candidatus Acidoferrales bacterium]|nr:winged helix-turn-helix domain-containing protein [Candidatus Acidoferrales bacterium]
MTPAGTATFGPYSVDLRSGQLRKLGVKVKMGEQPFQILLRLLETPGELVTREELRARLWADDTFVDFDHGLNSAVQRLRDCLSDNAETPLWIETVPRRGYRFVGKVVWAGSAAPTASDENAAAPAGGEEQKQQAPTVPAVSESVPPRPARRFGPAAIWTSAAVVLALACVAFVFGPRWRTPHAETPVAIRSIAVLPLENLSGDPSRDYFADGMTDELITTLAKYQALRVTSRTSVMRYKSVHRPFHEIAGELGGVDGVIVGSVLQSGDRLRVNVQLVRASDEAHVWSESYERDMGDVISLQQDLARAIADEVQVKSEPVQSAASTTGSRFNPAAHDAYLRGRYEWYKGDYLKSRQYFQQAIDLDPAYALGYDGLADSYIGACVSGEIAPADAMPKGEAAARKAVDIDDSLAESHNSLAAVKLFYRWDWAGAEAEAKRAIALNPSFSEAHHLYDYILGTMNRESEALEQEKIADRLDPFARPWAIGLLLVRQHRFDDAIRELHARLQDSPRDPGLHGLLFEAYYMKGMQREAVGEFKTVNVLMKSPGAAGEIDQVFASGGFRAVFEWYLRMLGEQSKKRYVSPVEFARFSAIAGDKDHAIRYLEDAYKAHAPRLIWLKQDPFFDSLHSDPRFESIVKRVGLP